MSEPIKTKIFLDIKADQDWQSHYILEIGAVKLDDNNLESELYLQCRRHKINNSSKNMLQVDQFFYADLELLEIDAYMQLYNFINKQPVYVYGSYIQELLDKVNRRLKLSKKINVIDVCEEIASNNLGYEFIFRHTSLKSMRNIFNLKTEPEEETDPLYSATCLKEFYNEFTKTKNSKNICEKLEHELFRPILSPMKWYRDWEDCVAPNIDQNFKVIIDKSTIEEVNLFEDEIQLSQTIYQLNLSFEIIDSDNKRKFIQKIERFKAKETAQQFSSTELKMLMEQYSLNVVVVTKNMNQLKKLFVDDSYNDDVGKLFYYLQYLTINKMSDARRIISSFFNNQYRNFEI
ncbi:MAG: hypothetical protein ACRC4L_00345 [Mycoplasma sp.]